MNKLTVCILTFLLLNPPALMATSKTSPDLEQLLPILHKEWQLEEPAQKAEGNRLFMLINGGATLYLSLGFQRALTATFIDKQGKPVNLDIFEMNSAAIAQQVNQKKIGSDVKKLSFGNDTSLESYYLNFWQGPYQITISASDEGLESIRSITELAKIVNKKIVTTLSKP